jgi:hypothetical protein
MLRAPVARNIVFPESIVKMSDRPNLRSIFDQVVPLAVLAVAGAALVYALSIAATLQELRALEPIIHPDFESSGCQPAGAASLVADGEPKPLGTAVQLPAGPAERSAICPPHPRQMRPQ